MVGQDGEKAPYDTDTGRVADPETKEPDHLPIPDNAAPFDGGADALQDLLPADGRQQKHAQEKTDQGEGAHTHKGGLQADTVLDAAAHERSQAQAQEEGHVEQPHGRPFTTLRGNIANIGLNYGHEHGRGDSMKKTNDYQSVDRI